ncbi:MAG TPA: MmcQ/YjbR family DNA-binding protein [Ignavibacteria bacterium]|nr:MmcQ/YjbR family DNA-binding protein [Ignavibacteria bacterium]
MIKTETFRELALSMPNAVELPHFDKASFRVNKKIFATLNTERNIATIKLNAVDQNVFASVNPGIIYPVPNKWGQQGWTHIDLRKVRKNTLIDALTTSYYVAASSDIK